MFPAQLHSVSLRHTVSLLLNECAMSPLGLKTVYMFACSSKLGFPWHVEYKVEPHAAALSKVCSARELLAVSAGNPA